MAESGCRAPSPSSGGSPARTWSAARPGYPPVSLRAKSCRHIRRHVEQVRGVSSIGHQTSSFDILPRAVHRRQSRPQRQDVDTNAVGDDERVATDVECVRAGSERVQTGRDILRSLDFRFNGFEPEHAGRCLNLAHIQRGGGIADISDDRQGRIRSLPAKGRPVLGTDLNRSESRLFTPVCGAPSTDVGVPWAPCRETQARLEFRVLAPG